MSCGRPPSKPLPAGVSQGNKPCFTPNATDLGTAFPVEDTGASRGARASQGTEGDRNAELRRWELPSGWRKPPLEHAVPEQAVMANVLNPETESITLNTELETPTLDPATEFEQPSYESTSNP